MLAILALVTAAVAGATPEAWHRYDIRVDEELSHLEVRACFADGLPNQLIADALIAADATLEFRYAREGQRVSAKPASNAVILPHPSDDGCIEWTTDLDLIAKANRGNLGYRSGKSLVLATGTWFWRPRVLTRTRDIEFRFHLPKDMQVSVPWHPLPVDDDITRFRYGNAPLHWSSLMALGALDTRTFKMHGARFRLAVTDSRTPADPEQVLDWLRPAANAVAQLWGRFPVDDVQLLVIPVGDGRDAAPWAQTNRGGGAGAHFYMNTRATDEMLRDDWIATHELAHFALPFVERRDAWLAEGFASYYQNVLRARAGMISVERAWQELYEGFQRGNRNTAYDTLRDDTLYMHSRGRVMRVYWSGAAIALLADVELRRRSRGEWSLDRVLEEFHRCCRKPERTWSGRELFEKFDAISGSEVFATLYRENVYSRHFPRLAETFVALGIDTAGGSVSLRADAPLSAIRAAIMAPRASQVPAANATGTDITSR